MGRRKPRVVRTIPVKVEGREGMAYLKSDGLVTVSGISGCRGQTTTQIGDEGSIDVLIGLMLLGLPAK